MRIYDTSEARRLRRERAREWESVNLLWGETVASVQIALSRSFSLRIFCDENISLGRVLYHRQSRVSW